MTNANEVRKLVDQFVVDEIDSVPHLEALLLLWSRRPKGWSPKEIAETLYVESGVAERILKDLSQRSLAVGTPGVSELFFYDSTSEERNRLVLALDGVYRQDLVRISTIIHSKASPASREFDKAFRFTKERG